MLKERREGWLCVGVYPQVRLCVCGLYCSKEAVRRIRRAGMSVRGAGELGVLECVGMKWVWCSLDLLLCVRTSLVLVSATFIELIIGK